MEGHFAGEGGLTLRWRRIGDTTAAIRAEFLFAIHLQKLRGNPE